MSVKDILSFSTPEAQGVSSADICAFIDALRERGLVMHSILLERHGKIIAQGYYKPYKKDDFQRMYSVSKSFVSGAVGMLAGEGRVSLDDPIAEYFPDKLPEKLHPFIAATTIRDCLRMATPYSGGVTYRPTDKDWAYTFFNPRELPDHPSGTVFNYDTCGSYLLDVIVERVTGKPFLDYMKDMGLRDIGFSEGAWCVKAPEGNSWGGSGVMCTTADLARYARLLLNGGAHNGKQIIPFDYVKAASSKQIDNCVSGHKTYLKGCGYGYQIWCSRGNSFSFQGMGGQVALCIPDKDIVFACTADVQGNPTGYNGVVESLWNEVIDKVAADALPDNPVAQKALDGKLAALECTPPQGMAESSFSREINNVRYSLNENKTCVREFTLSFNGDEGVLDYLTDEGEKQIKFGMGKFVIGTFPQNNYFGDTIGTPRGTPYRSMSAAVWAEPKKISIMTYIIDDYLGNVNLTFSFKGDEVGFSAEKSAEWFLDEYKGFAAGQKITEVSL